MSRRADIVMITYRSAGYLHLSLPRLLDSLGQEDRVWLWHNGDDEATLEALKPFLQDERVARFHHSRENVKLRQPTNWLWQESGATFVSKVDDDCLIDPHWLDTFRSYHSDVPDLGVIGSWRHPEQDFLPRVAERKITSHPGGHRIMRNAWVQGSGYLVRRDAVLALGGLQPAESFTALCIRLARTGAINGFAYPFVPEDHMDDPRSPHTLIRTDEDLAARLPLSAQANGVKTVAEWTDQLVQSAELLQRAPHDPKHYSGWRAKVRNGRRRIRKVLGARASW